MLLFPAMDPLLSVVITVYQGERFLSECLRSVSTAEYENLQIVLVNDGSTDRTSEICERWAREDARVELHNREHEGRNAALKFAHKQARGEAQCVVDADDTVYPRAFTRSMQKLSGSHELVYTYRELIDTAGNVISAHDKNKIRYRPDRLLVDNMIFHLRTFTTELFERAGGVGEFDRCEDWDENLRMSELTEVRCIPQILYQYRIHRGQISRTPKQNQQGAIAVRRAIKRRNRDVDLVVDQRGFHLVNRKPAAPLELP